MGWWLALSGAIGFCVGVVSACIGLKPSIKQLLRQRVRMCRITKVRLFQDPSVTPGEWQKTVVFGYDDLNDGWISAAFDKGMDYVYEQDVRLTAKQVEEQVARVKKIGYHEISAQYADRYGVSLNQLILDHDMYEKKTNN